METNVNYTIVGAFVITLLTATILAIIWLSSGFHFERYATYALYMQESVSGLNIDSPVEYNGVNVGTVKSLELDEKNPHLVEVLLNIKTTTPITVGTVATLATRGITGIAFIALKDKSTDRHKLVALKGQHYPVIQTAPSIFTRLDTALSKLSKNIETVTLSIQQLLNKENQESIQASLSNLEKITDNLVKNGKKFDLLLDNANKASAQFTPLMRRSENAIRSLEIQTLPAAYRLLSNLDEVTRTLNSVAMEIKQNPSILIRGAAPLPPGPGETK